MRKFQKFNHRYSMPKMEDMVPEELYSFTVNLDIGKIEPLSASVQRYDIKLRRLFKHGKYKLYPELSPIGKLHYHGYISFKTESDIFNFYRSIQKMQNISFEVDKINDPDVWQKYVKKQKRYKKMYTVLWDTKYTLKN